MHVILASSSPRRKDLLALLGISFDIVPPTSSEDVHDKESPVDHVHRLALEKARSVGNRYPESIIIGSDTVIEIDGRILGKPADLKEAEHMLKLLRGRSHLGAHRISRSLPSLIRWRRLGSNRSRSGSRAFSDSQLKAYLNTQDSLGKAGAYSIQGEGAHLIEKIEGDYPTVVGLPLWHTAKLLEASGSRIRRILVEEIYRVKPYANWKDFLYSRVSAPRDEVLLFRQKDPKPFPPVRGLFSRSLRHRPELRWLGNSLRSNSPRRKVDSRRQLSHAQGGGDN